MAFPAGFISSVTDTYSHSYLVPPCLTLCVSVPRIACVWSVGDLLVQVLKSEVLDATNVLGENVSDLSRCWSFFYVYAFVHALCMCFVHGHALGLYAVQGVSKCNAVRV